jgi:hypothetical protein
MSQTTYKKLDSGVPTGGLIIYDNLKQILGNGVDLDDSDALVAAGYVQFDEFPQPESTFDFRKEYVADTDVEISTGHWSNAWKLADKTLTASQLNEVKDRGYTELRKNRNYLLSKTDFYANSDVTMPDSIKTYRQALRDLPANTADPFDITWPTEPVV